MTTIIQISGLDDVQRDLSGIQKIPPQAIRDLAQFIFDRARKAAGAHTKTGALEQSTYLRKIEGGWEVGHDKQRAPHAVFVHWGTRAHIIKPKNRRALRWVNSGAFVFAGSVKHPGYKGDPWLVKAVEEANLNFERIANNSIRSAAP